MLGRTGERFVGKLEGPRTDISELDVRHLEIQLGVTGTTSSSAEGFVVVQLFSLDIHFPSSHWCFTLTPAYPGSDRYSQITID